MLKRDRIVPRTNWQQKVTDVGMNYHTLNDKLYWNESAYYKLSEDLVDRIDDVTEMIHDQCMEYCYKTINSGLYDPAYEFDDYTIGLIETSWSMLHPSIYGRFDFGLDVFNNLFMYEYNADTPTSLLEASVVQWNWKEEVFPGADQFNSIHEKLIEFWKTEFSNNHIYFATNENAPYEDWGTLHYLLETASEAGLNTTSINLEEIGFNNKDFVDVNNKEIANLFKLYPWEWFRKDQFYHEINKSGTMFINPPWTMLLSNKLLCVKLREMFPSNPYLLPAVINPAGYDKKYKGWIKKPYLGREGQGVEQYNETNHATLGVLQQNSYSITFDGIQPVIGSWIIGGKTAGIGIREDIGVTTNNSQFVPHMFI